MKKPQNSEHAIPPRLDYLAGLSWRLLVITGVIAVAIFLIIQLKVVIIPFLVALLVTALLFPFVKWLTKFGMKRGVAVAISVVLLVLVVGGLGFLVSREVRSLMVGEGRSSTPFSMAAREQGSRARSVA